jgi:hypothetical protein
MVLLRDLQPEDKEKLFLWRNDPEVAKWSLTGHQISIDEHERWFSTLEDNPRVRYWMVVVDDEDVGLVNLFDIDRINSRCFWSFYIGNTGVRGKGVGKLVHYHILRYVFEDIGLHKLCSEVLATNQRIIHMQEMFGFYREGQLREHVVKDGSYIDVICWGMLRQEWSQKKPAIEKLLRNQGLLPESEPV